MPERLSPSRSGGPCGSKHLPWDTSSIPSVSLDTPPAVGWARGCVCAEGVGASISPVVGISDTAKTPNACSWCAAGRPPSGKKDTASTPKLEKLMRQLSVGGAPAAAKKVGGLHSTANHPRTSIRIAARGHAARVFLALFAAAPAVTTPCVRPADGRVAIAAMIVGKPSSVCATANVSGWTATPTRNDARAAWSSSGLPPAQRGGRSAIEAAPDSLPGIGSSAGRPP
jgi:hypothetical protein